MELTQSHRGVIQEQTEDEWSLRVLIALARGGERGSLAGKSERGHPRSRDSSIGVLAGSGLSLETSFPLPKQVS
jgi:hypothetical protein